MTFCRRHDRFLARIGHAHGPAQNPGGERDERLHGKIELRAETAADRSRNDANLRRRDTDNSRDIVAVHIGRLGAGLHLDAIADAPGKAGFRLDIGVFDEAGFEQTFRENFRARHSRLEIAPRDAAAGQNIGAAIGVKERRALGQSRVHRRQRGQHCPSHRKPREVEPLHRLRLADDERDRLAAETGDLFCKGGLVGERADHAIAIFTRDIARLENGDKAGIGFDIGVRVANGEARVRMRRADRLGDERVGRPFVGAENLRPRKLFRAVQPCQAFADRAADRRLDHNSSVEAMRRHYGLDDLAIAGAAAEHAAERLHRLRFGRRGGFAQQRGRGQQHRRRADSALGGAMESEGAPQTRDDRLVVAEAFDRLDAAARHLADGCEARANGLAVDQHRAGAAIAGVATDFHARQAAILA